VQPSLLVFSELCSGGSLAAFLQNTLDSQDNPASLPPDVAASYLLQICNGLNALHSAGLYHGGSMGLCLDNVLIARGNVLKIANYYLFPSSASLSVEELSRRQNKDLQDLATLATSMQEEQTPLLRRYVRRVKPRTRAT
jgi:serine/threonine protein kinase